MPTKHQIIVFKEDLDFVGVYNSLVETAQQVLGDPGQNTNIAKYVSGKLNELQGHIFLEHEGYVTAASIENYRKAARSRKLLSNIFKIDTRLIAKLSEEDAHTIDTIIQKYM